MAGTHQKENAGADGCSLFSLTDCSTLLLVWSSPQPLLSHSVFPRVPSLGHGYLGCTCHRLTTSWVRIRCNIIYMLTIWCCIPRSCHPLQIALMLYPHGLWRTLCCWIPQKLRRRSLEHDNIWWVSTSRVASTWPGALCRSAMHSSCLVSCLIPGVWQA